MHEAILGTYLRCSDCSTTCATPTSRTRSRSGSRRSSSSSSPTVTSTCGSSSTATIRYIAPTPTFDASWPTATPSAVRSRASTLPLYRAHRDAYVRRFGRDLVGAFASLARSGHVEILTSAATHGYLPLLDRASVHAQLAVGTRTTRRRPGVEPRGIWLPECAYAPGLEEILEAYGLTHFFTDAALPRWEAPRRGRPYLRARAQRRRARCATDRCGRRHSASVPRP